MIMDIKQLDEILKSKGFDLKKDELEIVSKIVQKAENKELSDADLEEVIGGVDWNNMTKTQIWMCIIAAGVILGAGLAAINIAFTKTPTEQYKAYFNSLDDAGKRAELQKLGKWIRSANTKPPPLGSPEYDNYVKERELKEIITEHK